MEASPLSITSRARTDTEKVLGTSRIDCRDRQTGLDALPSACSLLQDQGVRGEKRGGQVRLHQLGAARWKE